MSQCHVCHMLCVIVSQMACDVTVSLCHMLCVIVSHMACDVTMSCVSHVVCHCVTGGV